MRRLLITLLTISFLLGQLGLIAHAYEKKKDGHTCELCIAASHMGQGLQPHIPTLKLDASSFCICNLDYHHFYSTRQTFYTPRSPPAYL